MSSYPRYTIAVTVAYNNYYTHLSNDSNLSTDYAEDRPNQCSLLTSIASTK